MKLYNMHKEVIYENKKVKNMKELVKLSLKKNVNLKGANLRDADLSYANLRDADLSYANLSYANLTNANLYGTIGNRKEIKSMQIEKYNIAFTKDILQIGCERHTFEEWRKFTDKEILEMNGKEALLWWRKWKDFIFQAIELSFYKE